MATSNKSELMFESESNPMLYSTMPKPWFQAPQVQEIKPQRAGSKPKKKIRLVPDYPKCDKMVLREPGGEYHTDSEFKEVYASMLSNQYYNPQTAKPGYEKYRRVLVDWMCEIGDTIKQAYTTIHHAVSVMDSYFSKHPDVESNNQGKRLLKLVALTSIFISAKFCEKDSRGPTARNISMLTRGEYSEEEILSYEGKILILINWTLMFSTPADFVSLFLNQGIVYSDDAVLSTKFPSNPSSPTLKNVRYVRKYCEFFVDLCLQEHSFKRYSSIVLGIAIVLAARKSVNITPVWNEEFGRLFMISFKHVEKCFLELYGFYESSFPSQSTAVLKPMKVNPSSNRSKLTHKKNTSVRTRYTSSDTTNRNSSSTKSSRRSNCIPKILSSKKNSVSGLFKASDKKSNNSSVIRDIKTPDKFIPLYQKNSSSNKKSTIKSFRPQNSNVRAVSELGMSGSSHKKKLKVCKNPDPKYKMPLKLDFNTRSMNNVQILTTKPNQKISVESKLSNNIPRVPQTKRNGQLSGTFCKASYDERPKLSSRNNMVTYSGIYGTQDNIKHNISHQEPSMNKENTGLRVNQNFRSMTSLMNKPAIRKFSIQKQRYGVGSNETSAFVSKREPSDSNPRKNIFQQISNLSRRDSSTRSKNTSITRRYAVGNQ